MANYYATMSLAALSGETADVNVNLFAFTGPGVFTTTEGEFVFDQVAQFYDTLATAGYMLGRADAGHSFKIYAATTATPNYPIDEHSFNFDTAPGAIDLPLEVSLCVSYANDSATIVPRARRRGRIYISGWPETANTAGRPTSTAYGVLVGAYRDYCDALNEGPGFEACVWSRANNSLYKIDRVWVDNEWDTMRSRGGKSTVRESYNIPWA